jgi:putative chitinase
VASAAAIAKNHFQNDAFVEAGAQRSPQLLASPQSLSARGLVVPQRELDFGDSGPDVLNLQQCLVALGFLGQDQLNSGPGNYGLITQQAVKDFQSRHGIQPVNGRFGPGTRATLEREVSRISQPPAPSAHSAMVQELYRQVLHRPADAAGLSTWTQKVQQLQSQGMGQAQIRSTIQGALANSQEGQAVAMVEQAFSEFLGRTNSGRSWWHDEATRRLGNGESFQAVRDSVRHGIRTSDEFYLKNPQQLVHDVYQAELGRNADPEGLRTRMGTFNTMRAQGHSISDIRKSITAAVRSSSEWLGRSGVSAEQLMAIVNVPGRGMTLGEAQALVPHLNAAMREFGITTPQQKAAFIAQCTHETDYFRTFTEYASGAAYEGRGDLGNTQAGDGVRFRGRGAIQLTGRHNYTAASRHFGVDFTREPNNQLVAQPEWAFRTAGWFFSSRGLTELAKNPANFNDISILVNGGGNGFHERQVLFARARQTLGF